MSTFLIDNYNFTSKRADSGLLRFVMGEALCGGDRPRETFVRRPGGMMGYAERWDGPCGVKVLAEPVRGVDQDGERRRDCHVIVTGQGCQLLGLEGLRSLWARADDEADAVDQKASRLDLTFDGVEGPGGGQLCPREVFEQVLIGRGDERELQRERVPRDRWQEGRRVLCRANLYAPKKAAGEKGGAVSYTCSPESGRTLYLGAESSKRRLRIYDKNGPVRVELQLRGRFAREAVEDLKACPDVEAMERRAKSLLREFVCFVRDGACHHEKREVLTGDLQPWWREFLQGAAKPAPRKREVAPASLQRKVYWLARQVASSIASVGSVVADLLGALLDRGEQRMSDVDRAILAQVGGQQFQLDEFFQLAPLGAVPITEVDGCWNTSVTAVQT